LQLAEPLIYWKGAYVPISQIHDPEVCPICGYFIMTQGDISEVNISENNEIKNILITEGQIKGFTYDTKEIRVPFQVSVSNKNFDAGGDQKLSTLIRKGYKVKGVYMEGRIFKRYIMAKEDIQ
jgi:hypothetical protein